MKKEKKQSKPQKTKLKRATSHNQFVLNLKQLDKLISQGHKEYALVLAGGLGVYSRKTITKSKFPVNMKHKYTIINHIDDTTQHLSAEELMNHRITNIGKAMPLKCLIAIIE